MRVREGGDHVQVHVNLPSRQDAPQRLGGRAQSSKQEGVSARGRRKSSQVKSSQVMSCHVMT
jgi:hypothetical protein